MGDEQIFLANRRLEQAQQCVKSAEVLMEIDDYRGAANRSYYAIFHAMRAVLALEGKDFAKHSGVISYFRKNYIKSQLFPVELSDIITEAFEIRSDSDYDDFYLIDKNEVEVQISNARIFLNNIEDFVKRQA